MFRRSLRWVLCFHVERDTARLIRSHRAAAIFVVRSAVLSAREGEDGGHWTRVLDEVERRVPYRPW